MPEPWIADVRAALADFTVDAVFAQLGPDAHAALARNETVPAARACADGSPLSTLIRLFSLARPVERAAAERAVPLEAMLAADLLAADGDQVRALVDIRPYGDESHDWWVVADLTPGLDTRPITVGPEHVLGISAASSSLAGLTVRHPVERALDLGTGCGVQALHLATHAQDVVATDVNPRALRLARLTAALNGVSVDVRDGSLFDPVVGERFDLISTNPPFVVSPPDGERLVYRETGFSGDEVVRRIIEGADDHLTEGGWCQVLASWIHPTGGSWEERLSGWIGPTCLDAWVVQREVLDPASYAEMWLADAGHRGTRGYTDRYDAWLSWFEREGIEAMGFGWISLRRAGRATPSVRIEASGAPVAPPVATTMTEWAASADALAAGDPLERAWRTPVDLVQDTHGGVGAVDPERIVVRRQLGLQRSRPVDTVEAALLSASDGDLSAGQILDAVSHLLDLDPAASRERYAPVVTDLIAQGFLQP